MAFLATFLFGLTAVALIWAVFSQNRKNWY